MSDVPGKATVVVGDVTESSLKHGSLGLLDTIAQSVTVMAPSMSGGFITYLAAVKAGGATPLAFLLATVACLLIGGVVSRFAHELRSAGSLYTYTVKGLGPFWGFLTGWGYGFGLWLAGPSVLAGSGVFMALFMSGIGAPSPFTQWWLWCGLGMLGWFVLGYNDVRISTRIFIVFTGIGMCVLMLLALIVIADGGAHGNTFRAFSPAAAGVRWSGVFGGVAFGLLSFTGFETSATLAEEAKRSGRDIPIAVMGAVLIGGVFYVVITYATSIGYGVHQATTAWPASASGIAPLASRYAKWMVNIVYLVVAVDAFLCGLGLANAVTRTVFAMSRDRVLPKVLSRTHRRHQSPWVALLAYLVVGIAFILLLIGVTSQHTRNLMAGGGGHLAAGLYVFGEGLTIIPPAIMIGYLLLCCAGIAQAARQRSAGFALLAATGAIASAVAVYGSLYFSFVPSTPGHPIITPYAVIPWLVGGWLLAGALVAWWLKARRPESWVGMGQVFE